MSNQIDFKDKNGDCWIWEEDIQKFINTLTYEELNEEEFYKFWKE